MGPRVLIGVALVALAALPPSLWRPGSSGALVPSPPPGAVTEAVWSGDLPEDVPYWPSPYDPEVEPPPALDVSSVVNPVQEIVALLASAPVIAPVIQQIRPAGTITTEEIIANARALLGVRYLWGGNTTAGMDCSAYVSRVWGLGRHTTDSLHLVAHPISREELRAGDALNLTRRQDPRGYGHVRLFERWANPQRTRMWVYEETPPRAVYRAIPYDPRYTPMRRNHYYPDETVEAVLVAEGMQERDGEQPLVMVSRAVLNPPPAGSSQRPGSRSTPQPAGRAPVALIPERQQEQAEERRPEPPSQPTRQRGREPAAATRTPAPQPERRPRTAGSATPAPIVRAREAAAPPTPPPPPPPTRTPTEVPATETPIPQPTATATPAGPPPAAPIRLTGMAQSCGQILVSWEYAQMGAAGVRLYRGGRFIGGVSGETRYYVDTGLAPGRVYAYTVTAWNSNGESPPSRSVEVRTHPPSQACKESKR